MQNALLAEQSRLTPDVIKQRLRQQFDTDIAQGILPSCTDDVRDRVIATAVDTMWEASRIKIYVPVLALRRARDEMRLLQVVAA